MTGLFGMRYQLVQWLIHLVAQQFVKLLPHSGNFRPWHPPKRKLPAQDDADRRIDPLERGIVTPRGRVPLALHKRVAPGGETARRRREIVTHLVRPILQQLVDCCDGLPA